MNDTIIVNGRKLPWLIVERGFKIPSFNFAIESENIRGRAGAVKKNRSLNAYSFELPLIVLNDYINGTKSYDDIANELTKFFDYDEPVKLQFESKDWYWNAEFEGPIEIYKETSGQINNFTITVVLNDPYRYAATGSMNTAISDQVSIVNTGTADTPITVEARALQDSSFFMITKSDEDYFMIGDDDVTVTPKDYTPKIYHNEFHDLIGWTRQSVGSINDTYLGGTLGGSYTIANNKESFKLNNAPSGSGWVGASYKRPLSKQLQDFRATFKAIIYQKDKGAGKTVQHIYDTENRLIAAIGYDNRFASKKSGRFIATLFNETGEQIKIYDKTNSAFISNMNVITIYIQITRKGEQFTVRSWLFDETKDPSRKRPLDTVERTYTDAGKFYQRPISSISISTFKYAGAKEMVMNPLGTFNTEILPKPKGAKDMIIKKGDLITIDTKNFNVVVNEEPFLHEKTFGSDFFNVDKGVSELMIYPTGVFDTTVRWQERFI